MCWAARIRLTSQTSPGGFLPSFLQKLCVAFTSCSVSYSIVLIRLYPYSLLRIILFSIFFLCCFCWMMLLYCFCGWSLILGVSFPLLAPNILCTISTLLEYYLGICFYACRWSTGIGEGEKSMHGLWGGGWHVSWRSLSFGWFILCLFSPCLHCYHPVYFSAHFPALMLLLAHPHASPLSWDALLCLLGHILL